MANQVDAQRERTDRNQQRCNQRKLRSITFPLGLVVLIIALAAGVFYIGPAIGELIFAKHGDKCDVPQPFPEPVSPNGIEIHSPAPVPS